MRERIERILLILLLILLPSQLALHFWPEWSLVFGVRVDYFSPTLYLTDIIIFGLWVFNKCHSEVKPKNPVLDPSRLLRMTIISFVVLNIFFALSPLVSLYKWIRIYEYFWLFKYLVNRKTLFLELLPTGLSIAVMWTSVLTIWQVLTQSSIGGLWYWVGERAFNVSTPGIAKVFIENIGMVLRPYATFPHPNALAGFLLVSGLILWRCNKKLIALLTLPLLVLTLSKSAILTTLVVLILVAARHFKKKIMYLGLLLLLVVYPLLPTSAESFPQRLLLNTTAFEVIKHNWLIGTGLGNFVLTVPQLRQPVHNLILLLGSELGVLMTGYIIIKSFKFFRNSSDWYVRLSLVVIILTGMVDHYWLTLHQTSLLFVVVLVLGTITTHATKNSL